MHLYLYIYIYIYIFAYNLIKCCSNKIGQHLTIEHDCIYHQYKISLESFLKLKVCKYTCMQNNAFAYHGERLLRMSYMPSNNGIKLNFKIAI